MDNNDLASLIEGFDQVKENFKESDPDLKLNSKYFSAAAVSPFMDHTSSSRGLMFSSHMSQPVIINNPDKDMVQTGLEYDLGKNTISKYVDNPSEVLAIIKRYNGLQDNEVVEHVVIFKDLTTGLIDALEIPAYQKLHPYFGYKLNTEKLSELSIGDTITSEEKLATPPTNMTETDYGFGKDLNVAQMTFPAVDEDGFVISESCAKKFSFSVFDTRIIEVGESSFLLNLYGEDGEYKPLPDIGEKISDTGAIAAVRFYSEDFSPMLMGTQDVKEFNPIFDKAIYGRSPESVVVDIKIYKNNRRKKFLPTNTSSFCDDYSEKLVNFHQQIINIYDSLNSTYKRSFGKDIEVGKTLYTLLTESYGVTEAAKENSKLRYKYRKDNVDLYRIEVTTETKFNRLNISHKLTDKHGGKGTVVDILPDDKMPRDKFGNVADIIIDPKSTISRLNIGRLYEMYVKASIAKATNLIKEEVAKHSKKLDLDDLTDKQIIDVFSIAVEYIDIYNNEYSVAMRKVLKDKDLDKMLSVLEETITEKLYVYLPLDNDKRKYEIVNDIVKSRFAPVMDKLYMDATETEETADDMLITPLYMFMLSKIADSTLAAASSKVNHFGLPVVANKNDKYDFPHKNSPGRFLGETELRILSAYTDPKFTAEFRDRNASIKSHKEVYHNLLTADKPTNVESLIDREKIPYGRDRALEILMSLWNSAGFTLINVDDKHLEYDYVEKDESMNLNADEIDKMADIDIDTDGD